MAGLVVANSTLFAAVLYYMGWAYADAFYGYFHISALELNSGLSDYILRSLSLFSPAVLGIAVAAVIAGSLRTSMTAWILKFAGRRLKITRQQWLEAQRKALRGIGLALSLLGLLLLSIASYVAISTYLILAMLGIGPILLTMSGRASPQGRAPYFVAVFVLIICTLWAGSLYAHDTGLSNARKVVRLLPDTRRIAVYSVDPLALTGPGVTVQELPSTNHYHYLYEGLRVLAVQGGTYYLLPVGWSPTLDLTYVIDTSDEVRLELY